MLKNLKKHFKRKHYSCKVCKDTKYITCPTCLGGGFYIPMCSSLDFFYTSINNHIYCRTCNGHRVIECPYCKSYENEVVKDDKNNIIENTKISDENTNVDFL